MTVSKTSSQAKIRLYVIIGLACVAGIVAFFVYQNTDSKVQTPVQNLSNPVKTEQTTKTIQPVYKPQETHAVPSSINTTLLEQDVHEIANQARISTGIQPISYDLRLAEIARTHSQDMAIHQLLSDNSYDGNNLNHRYAFAGYSCQEQVGSYVYSTGNENVAVVTAQGNESQMAQRVVNVWLNSIADRGNIFDTEHKTEGIGVAFTENKMALYATDDFC